VAGAGRVGGSLSDPLGYDLARALGRAAGSRPHRWMLEGSTCFTKAAAPPNFDVDDSLIGRDGRFADRNKEVIVYIGMGTVVVILVIVIFFMMMRRSRA
jgi:hypothetical protein